MRRGEERLQSLSLRLGISQVPTTGSSKHKAEWKHL